IADIAADDRPMLPLLTFPSLAHAPLSDDPPARDAEGREAVAPPGSWQNGPERLGTAVEPAVTRAPGARRRADTAARALPTYQPTRTLGVRERIARARRLQAEGVVYIPGKRMTRRLVPRAVRERIAQSFERASFVRVHKHVIFLAASLTILLGTVLGGTGTLLS